MRAAKMAGYALTLLLSVPGGAYAQSCTQSVVASGNLLDGRLYSARAVISGLSADSAFRQLRAIYELSRIRILSENRAAGTLQAEIGATAFEQARLINVLVHEEGASSSVQMAYTVKGGELVAGDSIRKHLCSVLTQLTGERLASSAAVGKGPIVIESRLLAQQVEAAKTNPAKLDTYFAGRMYRVSGLVLRISAVNKGYAVWFEGLPMLSSDLPGADRPQLAVQCIVPKQQAQAAAALTVRQRGTLVGRYSWLNQDPRAPAVVLEDCRSPQ